MGNRICIILPYYGREPWYFNYFQSSLRGKNFDVILFSDWAPRECVENLKVVTLPLDHLRSLITRKTGYDANVISGWKLCDVRPVFGRVFEDYISEYDYWGFGDCDCLYGNSFCKIIDETTAAGYDVISMTSGYVCGPFTLFKNCEKINSLYRNINRYDEVFKRDCNLTVDEIGGLWYQQLREGSMTLEDCSRIRDSLSAVVWRTPGIKLYAQDIRIDDFNISHMTYAMRGGRIFSEEGELALLHFMTVKQLGHSPFKCNARWRSINQIGDYYLTQYGFIHSRFLLMLRHFVFFPYRLLGKIARIIRHV